MRTLHCYSVVLCLLGAACTPPNATDEATASISAGTDAAPTGSTVWAANSPSFSHAIGSASGSAWVVASTSAPGFLTYGPYSKAFQNGAYKVSFNLSVDNNTADDATIAYVDIHDTVSNTVLARRDVHRREFAAANQAQAFDLSFTTQGANDLELRVYYFGYSYLKHSSTSISLIESTGTSATFHGNQASLSHQLGAAVGSQSWAAPSSAGVGYLTYGPYTTQFGAGAYVATFDLQVDNNSFDDSVVATVDVHNAGTDTILASVPITRQAFTAPNKSQAFAVPFNHDGVGSLEFRVEVSGKSYVQHNATVITSDINTRYLGTDPSLGHVVGYAVGSSWASDVTKGAGYLTYGPYTPNAPPGVSTVTFNLSIDNNTADDSTVVRLEAFDSKSGTTLASRIVKRRDFRGAAQRQDFDLAFESTAPTAMEFRVYTYGIAAITHNQTTLYPDRLTLGSLWDSKAHFEPRTRDSLTYVSSLVVHDGVWYAFVREQVSPKGCSGGYQTNVSQSTDHGVTWSTPIAALVPGASVSDACGVLDGGVYFDNDTDVWHALYQCIGTAGKWNLCHYTRAGSDPLGRFTADPYQQTAPSVTGGQLWKQICAGAGKACPASMVDEGTPQIIKKVDGYYYATFHGANYGAVVTGARGVARTADFIDWQVAGADLPDNAMVAPADCNAWNADWKAGGCVGTGDASLIRSGGYNYMLIEAADTTLVCTAGQTWVFGLIRSESLSPSGTWSSYAANPFVNPAHIPSGCSLQYMNLIRDRGEMFLHFYFFSLVGASSNQNYQLSLGSGPSQLTTQ